MSITSAIVTIIGAWGGGSALFGLFKSMLDENMPTLGKIHYGLSIGGILIMEVIMIVFLPHNL